MNNSTPSATSSANHALRAFEERDDLKAYGPNAYLLYALQLGLGIEDIHGVAASALTDGANDKKCDLLFVDREGGRAVIGQGYFATTPGKLAPPANKAADLNVATSWILGRKYDGMPETLKSAARELNDAIDAGTITRLEIWFVHNLDEVSQVEGELAAAAGMADTLVRSHAQPGPPISVAPVQVGLRKIADWHRRTQVLIQVDGEEEFEVADGFFERGDKWEAYCTSMAAREVRRLYRVYGEDLFASNVRGYLGSSHTDRRLNLGIQRTAREAPARFFAFNNGITAISYGFEVDRSTRTTRLRVRGLTIVNGAQTTGAIGSLDEDVAADARVMVRFVRCSDPTVVRDVVQYTNSQTQIDPSDFRSNDAIQHRLRHEFQTIPDAFYSGARRGGTWLDIAKHPGFVPSNAAAQALAAFHGMPDLGYHRLAELWSSDQQYARVFSEDTTARHVLFCFALLRAVEFRKRDIMQIPRANLAGTEVEQQAFLHERGSTHLFCAAIARCIETIIGQRLHNKRALMFRSNIGPDKAIAAWQPVVESHLNFATHLLPVFERGLQHAEGVATALRAFQAGVGATAKFHKEDYTAFKAHLALADLARGSVATGR